VSAAGRQAFLREIESASRIKHPAITRYLGWGESPHGGPYILSELVDGPPLAGSIPCDPLQGVRWIEEIVQAMDAAHQCGVIHGDLTPKNILLRETGRLVITDFGMAHVLSSNMGRNGPDDLEPFRGGTLGFAAPEQFSAAFGPIGVATDIYAVGGLAYYLLSGRGPHQSGDDWLSETLSDADPVIPVIEAAGDRSREGYRLAAQQTLQRIATLALRKAIEDRPQGMAALWRDAQL
jgi:eukaryotic-like serine/threonine-protein kinase